MRDSKGVNLKLLLSNEDGTSMVLMGTSVWDAGEEEDYLTSRWVCSMLKALFLYGERGVFAVATVFQ